MTESVNAVLAAALEVLDARPRGIDLYLQADFDKDDYRGFVRIHLDQAFMAKLHRRQSICRSEGLVDMNEKLEPAFWVAEPGALINGWNLSVDVDQFVFIGRDTSPGGRTFECVPVSITHLTEMLAQSSPSRLNILTDDSGSFTWVGNSLVYSEEASAGFVESILRRCPEVAAAQREIDMAQRIGGAGAARHPSLTAAPRRRPAV